MPMTEESASRTTTAGSSAQGPDSRSPIRSTPPGGSQTRARRSPIYRAALLRSAPCYRLARLVLSPRRPLRPSPHSARWVSPLQPALATPFLDRCAVPQPLNSAPCVSLKQADAQTPHFSWAAFYKGLGRDDVARFSLAQPKFFAAADKALATGPGAQWRSYQVGRQDA